MTTKEQLSEWFERGLRQDSTHMIIICDTFDYVDYPVFVQEYECASKIKMEYSLMEMSRVMEVYNLKLDKKLQLEQSRSYNF